jgi:hypothetical protein
MFKNVKEIQMSTKADPGIVESVGSTVVTIHKVSLHNLNREHHQSPMGINGVPPLILVFKWEFHLHSTFL